MRKFLLLISVALMSATAMADKDTEGYMFKDAQGCYYLIISETEVMLTGVLNQNDVTEYTIPETVTHPDGKTFTVASIATNYRSVTTASGKSSKLVASTPTDAEKLIVIEKALFHINSDDSTLRWLPDEIPSRRRRECPTCQNRAL